MTMKDDIDGNRLSDLWYDMIMFIVMLIIVMIVMVIMINDGWFIDYDQHQIDYDCVEQDNDDDDEEEDRDDCR